MQSILTVIHGQLVLDAVQRKPAFRDPVSVTTDDGAEVSAIPFYIFLEGVEAQHHIVELTITIRHFERD